MEPPIRKVAEFLIPITLPFSGREHYARIKMAYGFGNGVGDSEQLIASQLYAVVISCVLCTEAERVVLEEDSA